MQTFTLPRIDEMRRRLVELKIRPFAIGADVREGGRRYLTVPWDEIPDAAVAMISDMANSDATDAAATFEVAPELGH